MFDEEFLHEEALTTPPPVGALLSVRGWLQLTYGFEQGAEIYDGLRQVAREFATYDDVAGTPGIVFHDDDGEFVSLEAAVED